MLLPLFPFLMHSHHMRSSVLYPSIITIGDYLSHYDSYSKQYVYDPKSFSFGGSKRRTMMIWSVDQASSSPLRLVADRLRSMMDEDDVIEVAATLPFDQFLDTLSRAHIIVYPSLSSSPSSSPSLSSFPGQSPYRRPTK
eukprot:TRINITY_DN11559_c0_g1_i2.p1 TRINITY_DN11559_c0_g1~~TRINITY_DN11559_c0_g1_i2.p1  ORF type:complete len:139 (-),score=31.30 TRINITY_DN11559_c0_g1_i2:187-603(-)